MTTIPSASELYMRAAHREPLTDCVVESDTHCIMCGTALPAGTPAASHELYQKITGREFNNGFDLRNRGGTHVCGYCAVMLERGDEWTKNLKASYVTRDGVFGFGSVTGCASLFLNPPEPPFAVALGTRQKQHILWFTPVSLSREFYSIRVDESMLEVCQQRFLAGLAAYRRLEAAMAQIPSPITGKVLRGAPIHKPSGKLQFKRMTGVAGTNYGSPREDVRAFAMAVGESAAVETLDQMSMGERLGLALVTSPKLKRGTIPPREPLLAADGSLISKSKSKADDGDEA
ncbi:MAG TPA: type IV CRISPR-associated protein Csf1 [Nevskiaceae bacterium]|nr:type IV CRISPR-associated protein Csf1 [Nevskiaceae bacterium]